MELLHREVRLLVTHARPPAGSGLSGSGGTFSVVHPAWLLGVPRRRVHGTRE
jgi:hypothetical protein